MPGQVCVDASLALMLLLPHERTPKGEALWRSWRESHTLVVTAPLFFAETTSVLREAVHFGRITPEEGEIAFDDVYKLSVEGLDLPQLQRRAWELAKEYNRPRAYDAQYLAVASILGCELWTADRRLVNAVSTPWVRWVGEYKVSKP